MSHWRRERLRVGIERFSPARDDVCFTVRKRSVRNRPHFRRSAVRNVARKVPTVLPGCYLNRKPTGPYAVARAKRMICIGKLAHPTEFESVTSAFGGRYIAFAMVRHRTRYL